MKKALKTFTSLALCASMALSSVLLSSNSSPVKALNGRQPARVSVHDPSIAVSKEGTYYLFGSHIDAAKSTDLIDWQIFTNGYAKTNNKLYGDLSTNLSEPFKWAGENDVDSKGGFAVWAPDVFWNENYANADGSKGAYMIYFCTSSTSTRSAIAFATSQNIEGPYTYGKTLIYSGFTKENAYDAGSKINKKYTNTNIDELIEKGILKDGVNEKWFKSSTAYNNTNYPNAIDPTVFEDKEGKLWMTYGSWSGGIFLLEIDPATGEAKYPGSNSTTADGLLVDEYFGTCIAGGYAKSGEGPYILYDKETDYYYLYVTYEWLGGSGGYNMRLFRSKNPSGPYTDAAGNNAALPNSGTSHSSIGIKVMGNYLLPSKELDMQYMSPGHNSALIDEKTGQRFLFYHTRFNKEGAIHQVRVHQQFMNEQGWPVTVPYEYKGDTISTTGYSMDDIVGDYNYINHGTNNDGSSYKTVQKITLNSNGKISGAISGTWAIKDGTYYMNAVIGGVTYDGVFFLQQDESSYTNKVMTFSAIGTNNQTIWGVQTPMSISASKSTLYVGGDKNNTTQLTISGLAGRDAKISYKSSSSGVASVSSSGKVTAKKAGTTTITASVTLGSTTKSYTKKITVKKASLTLKKKKKSLKVKKSCKYTVTAKGIKSSSVRWSSSNKRVIKINAKTGKAKALKAGTVTITAKYKNIKAKIKVKVKK